MAIAEGSTTYFALKKEATPNVQETGAGGRVIRRVTGSIDLEKPEVTSGEKRTDFQEVNVTHGTRSATWSVNGEMYSGDYGDLLAAICRRNFTAVSAIDAGVGEEFTISSGVLTRAGGSFISDGAVTGLVGRLSAMTVTGNNSRNLLITSVAATTAGILAVDGGAAVADDGTADDNASLVVPGKYTFIPETGHTSDTFTIERYDSKTDTSKVAYGCKVGSVTITVPVDQPPTIDFSGIGLSAAGAATSAAPVLTSPTAAGTGALIATSIGIARINGASSQIIVGATLTIDTGLNAPGRAFSNISPDVFYGRAATVTGELQFFVQDNTIFDLWDDETEFEVNLFLAAPGSEPKSFYNFFLPRVKLTSYSEDDPDGPVIATAGFRALKKATATGYAATTLLIQDSALS